MRERLQQLIDTNEFEFLKTMSEEDIWKFAFAIFYVFLGREERTGYWKLRKDMDYLDKNKVMHNHFMCQDCGFIHNFIDGHTTQYNYCPNCGAKMEVEE